MVMQFTHHVVDCAIGGCPVELQAEHIGRELACGHCHGHFVVLRTDDGQLTATAMGGTDALERADELLRCAVPETRHGSTNRPNRLPEFLPVLDEDDRCQGGLATSPEGDEWNAFEQPIVLLVENRDEVFARIATDIAETGMRVIRARSATEALQLCGTYAPALVVANLDLPDQSGWLLAGKLQFVTSEIDIWLYQSQSSEYDEGLARFLQVDELLEYGGDLLGLSETIIELMNDQHEMDDASNNSRKTFAA